MKEGPSDASASELSAPGAAYQNWLDRNRDKLNERRRRRTLRKLFDTFARRKL